MGDDFYIFSLFTFFVLLAFSIIADEVDVPVLSYILLPFDEN